MIYNGYLTNLAKRVDRLLDEILVERNFEYGPEFEIALCRIIRTMLPGRFGICRGYVVELSGKTAGDDIIIYDALRFPTLRALDQQLELKEQVPAEAVLAYIEAKRTLYVEPRDDKNFGQSLEKALTQVAAVKSLRRGDVPLNAIAPYVNLNVTLSISGAPPDGSPPPIVAKIDVPPTPGYPSIRNPWFGMIIADRLDTGLGDPRDALWSALEASTQRPLPDVIVAGNVFVFPAIRNPATASPEGRSFLCESTELVATTCSSRTVSIGLLNMLMAIDSILLGPLPLGALLQEAVDPNQGAPWRRGTTPLR